LANVIFVVVANFTPPRIENGPTKVNVRFELDFVVSVSVTQYIVVAYKVPVK
jgi:hypothetical protein